MISILLFSVFLTAVSAIPTEQHPLGNGLLSHPYQTKSNATGSSRGLKGRFLHVTGKSCALFVPPYADCYPADFHPDGHYRVGTSVDIACHRGKGASGYFGAEGTDCDAPLSLANETLRWVEENLKDTIDFVVWTGDSARHDYDEEIPRTEDEVFSLQRFLTNGLIEALEKNDRSENGNPSNLSIPIVPTIGNNDVMPHNIFKKAPNKWTRKFLGIWGELIPETQRHSFVEGGWFTTEVIPGKLAVISLNTLYFFGSNNAVDGCKAKSEPGYEHMEWLRVQLKLLRDRQMKAILIGHVPPARSGSKRNWDETCWQKYSLWLRQYRDVVVGSVYGHMNIDHFMFQDSEEIKIADHGEDDALYGVSEDSGVSVQSRAGYLNSLREQWAKFPSPPSDFPFDAYSAEDPAVYGDSPSVQKSKKRKMKQFLQKVGGHWVERYSVSLVSPSVIPGYFPTLRVIEYNTTGLEGAATWADACDDNTFSDLSYSGVDESSHAEDDWPPEEGINKKKGKKKKKPKFKVPDPPSPSAPPGPAYSNQPLTWLGYTQYYANLTRINGQVSKLQERLAEDKLAKAAHDIFTYEVEYSTQDDKIYKLRDLTVRSFFKLATLIAKSDPNRTDSALFGDAPLVDETPVEQNQAAGNSSVSNPDTSKKKKKYKNLVWRTFLNRAFVGFLDIDELDEADEV